MRRDPLEIMEKMLEILEREHEALSVNQIAKRTGLHNITVRRYVRIIEMVRREPRLEVIKTRHTIILRIEKNNK
ncbi:MAG: HTH domain-containing protein [Candidatus Aenigmarchaeota archaeon]|nr:HTH domain-containing protein [Candidatus Aenigmarchaeota archaeon]